MASGADAIVLARNAIADWAAASADLRRIVVPEAFCLMTGALKQSRFVRDRVLASLR